MDEPSITVSRLDRAIAQAPTALEHAVYRKNLEEVRNLIAFSKLHDRDYWPRPGATQGGEARPKGKK